MNIRITVTFKDGETLRGFLTTHHTASSKGQPVFVDERGLAHAWIQIKTISTARQLGHKGGLSKTKKKMEAARKNGRSGGRPRKEKLHAHPRNHS